MPLSKCRKSGQASNLEGGRGKTLYFSGTRIRSTSDFFWDSMPVRWQWKETFQVSNGKQPPRIVYPVNVSFTREREIKTFSGGGGRGEQVKELGNGGEMLTRRAPETCWGWVGGEGGLPWRSKQGKGGRQSHVRMGESSRQREQQGQRPEVGWSVGATGKAGAEGVR